MVCILKCRVQDCHRIPWILGEFLLAILDIPVCINNKINSTVFMLIERVIQLSQENSIPGIVRMEATACNYFL